LKAPSRHGWQYEEGAMRKEQILLLGLIIPLMSACSSGAPQSPAMPEKQSGIKLGSFIGLSGDIVAYGDYQQKGISLAVKEINDNNYLGKTSKIDMVIVDTGATPDGAKASATKLISSEQVVGLIGPTLSSQAFASDPVAQQNKVPIIAVSNTVPGITEMGNYVFRCSLPESTVIAGTIKVAASQLAVKKVALLWGKDDDYTIAGYKAFADAVDKNGLQVVAYETFLRGDTDFKAQLGRIVALNPDAILVSALAKEAAPIIVQARKLGFSGLIIGGNGFNSTDVIKQAGADAEGVMAGTAWNINSTNPRSLEFISSFQKAYGIKPDQFAAQAYTGAWLFAYAIRSVGAPTTQAIRDSLAAISNFTTPLGSFSFTADREPVHSCVVQIVRNGKFVLYNP